LSSILTVLFSILLSFSLLSPGLVNINTAGERDLRELPGIGPVKAEAIIEFRERFGPYLFPDDLLLVPGIGPSTLNGMSELITVGEPEGGMADTTHWLLVGDLEDTLLVLTFLDIGNGDAILLEVPGGETWLIDGGPDKGGPLVAPVAARLLGLGVDSIDVVAFTHPHADHIGGLPDVMRYFTVASVLDPGMQYTSWLYEDLLTAILDSGADYAIITSGDVFYLSSDVSVEVLYSDPDSLLDLDLNEASAVFLVSCGSFRALLAGDIEEDTERLLAGSIAPVTIMLAPHHGSRTSAFPPFLRGLRPQLAVFSAGRNNPFGHPHPEVVEAYVDLRGKILRTDLLGTIVVRTDGYSIQFSSNMRGSP